MDEALTLTSFWASPISLLTPWKILERGCAVINGSSSSLLISSSPSKSSSYNFSFLSLR